MANDLSPIMGLRLSTDGDIVDHILFFRDNFSKIDNAWKDFAVNAKWYGAIGDGATHPASSKYTTLADAQVDYPSCVALTDELDTLAIQKAIEVLRTNGGGTLIVPDGTYLMSNTIRFCSNMQLMSRPNTKYLRKFVGTMFASYLTTDNVTGYNGQQGITVNGGWFDSNGDEITGAATVFTFAHGQAIEVHSIKVTDVNQYHAIDITACNFVHIHGNRFLGFRDNSSDQSRFMSEAVQIDMAIPGASDALAVDYTPSKNIYFHDNYVGSSGTSGFTAFAGGVGSHTSRYGVYNEHIIVTDNVFDGCPYWGIHGFKWKNVVIKGNIMRNCGGGIYLTMAAQDMESAKNTAGTVVSPTDVIRQMIISDNIIDTTIDKEGIYIYGVDSTYITNVILKSNYIKNAYTEMLQMKYVSGSVVEGNIFDTSQTEQGIELDNCKRITLANNRITGSAKDGMYISACNLLQILGNNVYSTKTHGIHITDASYAITLANNMISNPSQLADNSYDGILVDVNSHELIIAGNTVRMDGSPTNRVRHALWLTNTISKVTRYGNDWTANGGSSNVLDESTTPVTNAVDLV